MKTGMMKKSRWLAMGIALAVLLTTGEQWTQQADAQSTTPRPVDVYVAAAQGDAASGNTQEANFLVVVTDRRTGLPITSLTRSNFGIINHFRTSGALCGFSNNITAFNNVGTGAYHIQVKLVTSVAGCTWVAGDYLFQVRVSSGSIQGQAAGKLTIN